MSAVATAPAIETGVAHAVLHLALSATWPERGEARAAIRTAAFSLDGTLRACQERAGDPEAAEAAAKAAAGLIHVMTGHCGPGWGGQ